MNFALNTNLYSIKYPCLPLPKTISKKSNPMCKPHIGSLIHVILWSMLFSYILSIFISSVFSREPIRYQPPAYVGQLSTHNSPWSPGPFATVNTTSWIPWRSSGFSLLRAQVQLLVWELRSHEPCKDTVPHRTMGKTSVPSPHLLVLYSFPHRGILWLPLRDDSS